MINGDGSGNGADAGFAPAVVVLTSGSYSNPGWITALAAAKISGLATVATSGSASDLGTGTLLEARLPSTFSIAGPITLSGSGAGALDLAAGTAPSAPGSGIYTLFFNSANSNHFSVENSGAAVTDLQFITSLSTTGTSGAASVSAGVLNIPQYSGGGGGTLPTSWTVVNGAVLNNFQADMIESSSPANGALNWRFVTQSLSAPPYTVIARIRCQNNNVNTSSCGLYLYDGAKVEGTEVLVSSGSAQLRVEKMTNTTTDSATLAGPTSSLVGVLMTLKIVDDSTHRTFYYWSNGSFTQFFQETTGTYLTPTSVGFGGVSAASGAPASSTLSYWCVSTTTTCNGL
jgi:hypothetical protein